MRKATKRNEEKPAENATAPEVSPPKKTKSRKPGKRNDEKLTENDSPHEVSPPKKSRTRKPVDVDELASQIEQRLPRAAKTNAKAALRVKINSNNNNNNKNVNAVEKTTTNGQNGLQKSNSTDNVTRVETPFNMKKSRSTEDLTPKKLEPSGETKAMKNRKKITKIEMAVEDNEDEMAVKKAGNESKANPRGKGKKVEENEAEDEEVAPPVQKKISGRGATKKVMTNVTKEEKEVPKKRAAASKKAGPDS